LIKFGGTEKASSELIEKTRAEKDMAKRDADDVQKLLEAARREQAVKAAKAAEAAKRKKVSSKIGIH
jgi:hypothetical protein